MEEHLLNEFEEFGLTPNKRVLEKCIELLKKYEITPDTLVNHWIGYAATKLNDEAPSLENMILFEKDLSKELSAKTKVKSEPLSESPVIHNITTITQIAEDDELLVGYGTPVRKYKVEKKRLSKSTWLTKHRGVFFKVKYSPPPFVCRPWPYRNLCTHLPADTAAAVYAFPSFLLFSTLYFQIGCREKILDKESEMGGDGGSRVPPLLLQEYGEGERTLLLLSSVGAKRTSGLEGTPQNKRLAGLGQTYSVHTPSAFSPSTPGTSSKFSTRNNAGEVVVKYPADDAVINWTRSNETWEPDIQLHGTAETKLTTKYNYMFSRLRDKFDVLEEQINDLGDLVKRKLGIDDFDPNSVLKSVETFHTIGRICCDATSGSRLNTSSLLLEGTRNTSSGQSVPLDVSQLREFSFFPGQVVAVEGSNPTGKKMVVTSVTTPPINPVLKTDVSIEGRGPLNVMVACGPFTLPDDLEFAPLVEFIQQVNALLPHLVIIMGPFVDVKNKKVECGDLDYTYQEQFDIVMKELQSKITNSVQVCIIPSWRDVHYRTVYPTPPFPQENKAPNVNFFSDPCVLNVNGIFIALTSTDILFHLSKEEIAVTPHGSDRLGRLVSHLFSQQSFYPLNPPSEEMSIDLEQAEDHCKLSFTPHLLFVPSDLRHFIKNVSGCVVVNMERAVKGFCGGTYSRLQITGEGSSVQIKAEIVRL
ncbi:DNA polymerase alpha subunit B [Daphnia magna]|uniref:DNA polymerase alpha subunit B n=1 Tax=Daphnia magna TaxID=35525 RepID=A0A164QQF4_9CRUS|nr:DNA polymerase alpha subunit B [Daphnia magna]